jgi:hypothetical protein
MKSISKQERIQIESSWASGYLLKGSSAGNLIRAMEAVQNGGTFFSVDGGPRNERAWCSVRFKVKTASTVTISDSKRDPNEKRRKTIKKTIFLLISKGQGINLRL